MEGNNNKEFVGVDDEFKPNEEETKEEKKDDSLGSKIAEDANAAYDKARDYVSDKDNQEKMKAVGKKGLKIAKGVGIGYLIFFGIVLVGVIVTFVLVFSNIFKTESVSEDINNKAIELEEQQQETISNVQVDMFNSEFEVYAGTQRGAVVLSVLDRVVVKIKKDTDHKITVAYNNNVTSVADDIVKLKTNFDATKKYEVTFDYDNDGYINKLTIFDTNN